jgi:hypothetical protein
MACYCGSSGSVLRFFGSSLVRLRVHRSGSRASDRAVSLARSAAYSRAVLRSRPPPPGLWTGVSLALSVELSGLAARRVVTGGSSLGGACHGLRLAPSVGAARRLDRQGIESALPGPTPTRHAAYWAIQSSQNTAVNRHRCKPRRGLASSVTMTVIEEPTRFDCESRLPGAVMRFEQELRSTSSPRPPRFGRRSAPGPFAGE